MNRTLVGLLKLHKLGPVFSFVDGFEERGNSIVFRCKNEILAKMLQERFASEIREIEERLGITVTFTYPKSPERVFKESFENFFYGKENEFTVAALRSVALGNGNIPWVFLVGDSGMGKTHLLKATANLVNFTGRKAVYMTSGSLTDFLVATFRGERREPLPLKEADVILIDDVHALGRKTFALEYLSRLLDRAKTRRKVVVMASEMGPKRFRVSAGFRNRVLSNLVLYIHPYPEHIRKKILLHRLGFHGINLPPKYISYAVKRVENPGGLVGVVVRVRAHMDVYGGIPDYGTFKSLISDLAQEERVDVFSLFGVNPSSRRKGKNFYLAVYAMKMLGYGALEIAEAVGCSRASVYNYLKRAKEVLKNDVDAERYFKTRMGLLKRSLL